ncbi:putative transcription factor B3-Domain family [Helianthus annuus]|nr:putative transcription factor B3-Domain family [Helianthus annuus]
MSFYKFFSSVTKEFLVIPEIFCKTWLSSVVDNNNAVIRCVNDKTWLVNFAGHKGRFVFMEGWEKVVANLSLSEGTVLVFRNIGPYIFLLTPFMKVTPYQHCQHKFVMFSAISSFVHKKYIESFCHFVNENTVERLLLPTNFVKNTIGVSKLKGAMKVYINVWNWFDVFIEKDRISKSAMENTAGGVDKPAGQTSNATPVVVELPDKQPAFDDECDSLDKDSDYHDSGDGSSGSDVSMDDVSDDKEDEDSGGSSDDDKDDLDYHLGQFVWKFDRRFRLNATVVVMSRIDMSLKLTIQNLHGVDSVIDFRPERHGQGFRYAASQWRKKFLIPNDIKASQKCTFVYEPDVGKLILKKVSM